MGASDVLTRERTVPIVEVFGPTIQGEGPLAGVPTHFIRVGLCDYRCSWCDSMYAVDPEEVKRGATRMTSEQIQKAVMGLRQGPRWVTLSGGNPAIHDLSELVKRLHDIELLVAVETQGSVWRDWLGEVDQLVVSPKPPSSGMATVQHAAFEREFIGSAEALRMTSAMKIVVFDEIDLEWAVNRFGWCSEWWEKFISAGTPQGETDGSTLIAILDRYQWLCDAVAGRVELRDVAVLPQLHVLAWGTRRGV